MNKRFTQLKELSASEWQVLLTSLPLLALIALALNTKGYKWTRAFLQSRVPDCAPTPTQSTLETAQATARMVAVAARYGPYRANCLKQALTTWWLLLRRGITTDLKIGVNREDGDFNAHSWVEYRGTVLVEADDVGDRYSTFDHR